MSDPTDAQQRLARIEHEIRAAAEGGAQGEAARLAITHYGPELLRFIAAMIRDEGLASEVFGQTCEDVWRGVPTMRWQSSFRTYCYAVARNACHRALRSPHQKRSVPLEDAPEIAALAATARTATAPYLRTETKHAMSSLRAQLSPDEQALLTLRVDRDLDWNDIADVLADAPLDDVTRKRAAAQQRKRFERLTDKLRKLAVDAGILGESDDERA